MDFYIYGFIVLFIIICGIFGYIIFTKEKKIEIHLDHSFKRGGFHNVPGMKSNFSKKHKKRFY